ncbi:molybdate ABC transporter substrate-binding protein [Sphingomonas koreensis]|jgi:molybdate transport system substrate-binding protein|uniref:Molybdate ABC transporter substrate-binding protein n=1 Tax=Sphingomonas koreensis TaxID=93064 RepID=A0A1L6JDU9_9SPHN|nr:molybdate ABC transporter substrate-binding protein [Sphingomonas koreensis]APR54106.1 molybdate ABC transporter substrate-binding protein [Sphingomonas koreensis]MDC7809087.1 molybdate ABC transporter substrate-binding protein [Sphingomonas koreensis]RSU18742.1 molybdate ABC transporter substrate-binding protein [Sphingomonas koreensis]RSU25518.1 molybdate ABC transporter substrate-binding protein [Sphingomonas koreensis]RSU25747.1 molybdate ABC transporter substrate-binding protein [Sphin
MRIARRSLIGLALGLGLAAIPAAAQGRDGPLVLAAASLQESMTAAADAWAHKGHPRPVISFAASSVLARQVTAGARADLFVSADLEWMDFLDQRAMLAPATRAPFLGNRLVLVARANALAERRPLAAMLRGRIAVADPASVPAGRYAEEALRKLKLWDKAAPQLVRAENVRAALALVERGAAPYGIVYATDARASARVRVAGVFPQSSHPPIVYPLARLKTSTHPEAEGFRRFLLSGEGRAIFFRFGFSRR